MTFNMSNLSEQRIVVYCDFAKSMDDAIIHGVRMAAIFKKELCLFHPLGSGGKEDRLKVQRKLGKVIRRIKENEQGLVISSLTLKGDLAGSIERIAEDYDGIMLILTPENIKKKLSALQQSSIPFLFINGSGKKYLKYDRVILPLLPAKAAKNTVLWASYFGRFNLSATTILVANEKDEKLQEQTRQNLKFAEELFLKLKLKPQVQQSGHASFDLLSETLNKNLHEAVNLIIIPSGQQSSLIDLITGPQEAKIIRQAGELPVLCINSNRDMYVLCD